MTSCKLNVWAVLFLGMFLTFVLSWTDVFNYTLIWILLISAVALLSLGHQAYSYLRGR